MSPERARDQIETAIDIARERVSDRIDELDRRLRDQLDLGKAAGDHAPQLLAAGAVFGLLVGLGIPKVLLRSIQLGVPIWLAVQIVKKRRDAARDLGDPVP
ncbi:MAG TPA: hypothetical protein VMS56_13280 [Thermoanaerobaculia bacterium]|nr:hypothetical protein [Thermoanaerobaculia bacterium]